MRIAPRVDLPEAEKGLLENWTQGRKTTVRVAERTRIVLLAAKGEQGLQIASQLNITPK